MTAKPCGDDCCGHSFRCATKVCAGIDIAFGLIGFISTLAVVLSWKSVQEETMKQYHKKYIEEQALKDAETLRKELAWIESYLKTMHGIMTVVCVVSAMQLLFALVLLWAASAKSKTGCIIWIVVTIPQLPFAPLRIIQLLIVISFIREIELDRVAQVPTFSEQQRYPGQSQSGNEVKAGYGNSAQAFTSPSGYPPPPRYEYPDPAHYNYNSFAAPTYSSGVNGLSKW